jgi:hypothetical protein
MKWYFQIRGGYTHVRVFMNGGKCGDLFFLNEEFQQVRQSIGQSHRCAPLDPLITFIDETPATETTINHQTHESKLTLDALRNLRIM